MIKKASELAFELYVRNLQSSYIAMNTASKKVAAVPGLGIFWIEEASNSFHIFGKSISPRDAESLSGYKVNPQNHFEIWGEIQKENPKWIGKNYMSVPRGRVSLNADIEDPYFHIFLPPQYEGNKDLEAAVLDKYNIPASSARFDYSDPHYKTR